MHERKMRKKVCSASLQSRFPCSQPSARFLPFKFALTSGCAVQHHGVFGVHLYESIKYAKAAIWLINDNGERFIAGYIPTVVAKCGIFLKSKGTDVEGIFRLSGSARRIKDLQEIFDSPKLYGKDLDWSGYTVHDAANVLRRYLNQLPEPVIPLNFYERFRDPLRYYQVYAVSDVDAKSDFDVQQLVAGYQKLIQKLPPLNRQLLLYMLNILALFVSKSDQNLMTSSNLAVIFQPSILSHPSHDMAPEEYKRSQDVLTFLLENQEHFFAGMNEAAGPPQGGRRGAGRRKRKGKESSEIEHQKDGIQSERQRSFSFERSFSFDRICPENIDIRAIVHCPKNPQKRHQQWLQLFKRANKSFGI
jgi:GTPase-activating protein SAC7